MKGNMMYRLAAWKQCSYWWDVPKDKWPEGVIPLIPVEVKA